MTRKEKHLLAAATGGARSTMLVALRFSEALGKGPALVRAPESGIVDIGWVFTPPPEGLTEDDMSPDLTVRIRFSKVTHNSMRVDTTMYYGPLLPDAVDVKKVCQDLLELLSIEAGQTRKGGR